MRRKLASDLRKVALFLEKTAAEDTEFFEKLAAKKKKKPGRSYQGWLAALKKKGAPEKVIDSFKGRWKGALEYAKNKKDQKRFDSVEKREEYAARVAIDKLPPEYLDKPTEVHGPEKRGPISKKKSNEESVSYTVLTPQSNASIQAIEDLVGKSQVDIEGGNGNAQLRIPKSLISLYMKGIESRIKAKFPDAIIKPADEVNRPGVERF